MLVRLRRLELKQLDVLLCAYKKKLLGITGSIRLLENSLSRAAVLKSNRVADFLSKHDVHFICHSLSHTHSSHSPGLSTGYSPLRSRLALHHVHTPLWDLEIEAKVAIN